MMQAFLQFAGAEKRKNKTTRKLQYRQKGICHTAKYF